MLRSAFVLFNMIVLLSWLLPGVAAAQTFPWPDVDISRGFPYGPGFYLSATKIALCWFVFCFWVYSSEFVNFQGQRRKYRYVRWNNLVFFTFVPSFILVWFIPIFWLSFPLMLLAWIVPLTLFIRHYNRDVPYDEQVMTGPHLRFWFAGVVAPLGIKIEAERRSPDELIAVKLVAKGGESSTHDGANLLQAKESPVFNLTRELLVDVFARRGEALMLDYTQQAVGVRIQVDGLWTNGEPLDRETGDGMLAVLKIISSLNPGERRKRQQGEFEASYGKKKYTCTITTQGTKTGERALIQFDDGASQFEKLPDLGMREKMVDQVREILAHNEGFFLISAPPGAGLTATIAGALGSADRYTRDFKAVEDKQNLEAPIENIEQVTYDSAAGESPDSILPQLLLKHPDVIVCRDLVNLQTVDILCGQAEGRLVISSIRAKDCVEALLRVLAFKAEPEKFANVVTGVINQRLVRRLCDTCKEAYAPQPQLLKKLGLPAGRVEALYRPPQQPEEVCPDCGGMGYLGRIGVFELLVVGDHMRQYLAKGAKLDVLRKVARKEGMRSLQEEGILLVAKGVTSLPELMRVLKE